MSNCVTFDAIKVGDDLKQLTKTVTIPQLFMFSAIIWNPQRMHYDPEYARTEAKLPGALVHAPLEACFLVQMLQDHMGVDRSIKKLGWSNRGMAVQDETLVVGGSIVNKYVKDNERIIECEVWIKNEKGENVVSGNALIVDHEKLIN